MCGRRWAGPCQKADGRLVLGRRQRPLFATGAVYTPRSGGASRFFRTTIGAFNAYSSIHRRSSGSICRPTTTSDREARSRQDSRSHRDGEQAAGGLSGQVGRWQADVDGLRGTSRDSPSNAPYLHCTPGRSSRVPVLPPCGCASSRVLGWTSRWINGVSRCSAR